MKKLEHYFEHTYQKHVLFWVMAFCFYMASNHEAFSSLEEALSTYGAKVGLQIAATYALLLFVIPRFLARKNYWEFAISILMVLFLVNFCYTSWRMGYLEPTFPDSYINFFNIYGKQTYLERVFNFNMIIAKIPAFYLQPALLLLIFQFYEKQQKLLELNEQKKTAELSALKNQLNPHFLFNTLNNLYALALKKSDKTPEVIGKLSDILDYMLYRCNEKFVDLEKEIQLLENYLTLEKIRYGKRVKFTFEHSIDASVKIAPLLLLTFVENACKHGVSQELNRAIIDITIIAQAKEIIFKVKNTIPSANATTAHSKDAIGLKNTKKQLELIYPNAYQLNIDKTKGNFLVQLNIHTT